MEKINFQDYPNITTPINSTNLNQLQTNIENEINISIETDNQPIKTPFILDDKPVYIYRKYLGALPNNNSQSYITSILDSDIKDILIMFGTAVRNTNQQYNEWFNLGSARTSVSAQISLNSTVPTDGYFTFIVETGQDRTSLYGTATMLFTYND